MIDLIIGLVAAEALGILLWQRLTGKGPAPLSLLCTLLAGTFLLLALRSALAGASSGWIALCLLASFAAHGLDLRERWNLRAGGPAPEGKTPAMNATLSLRVPEQKARPADSAPSGE